MYQLLHDMPELFTKIAQSSIETEELMNILAPSGEMIYSVRIPGTGRLMLSIKVNTGRITITNVRSMEKTEWNIEDLADFVVDILSRANTEDPVKAWTSIYKEEYPKKAEIAPVQQEKPVQRKEKKVQKAKIEKPKPQSVEENTEDEQIPGQDSIENHPEYMPETKASTEENEKQEELETAENIEETEQECWRVIKEAGRKIELFIRDYSDGFIIPSESNVAAVEENCKSIITELKDM